MRTMTPAVVLSLLALASGPSATPKAPVADLYHGVTVTDDYRWLEHWDDPKVKAWSEAQNAYARSILDRLPEVDAIRDQVARIRKIGIPRFRSLSWRGRPTVPSTCLSSGP